MPFAEITYELRAAAEHSLPVEERQPSLLQLVHAVALLRLVEGEGLLRCEVVVELGEHELAVAGDDRAGGVAVVARPQLPRLARGEQVLDEAGALVAGGGGGLRGRAGAGAAA